MLNGPQLWAFVVPYDEALAHRTNRLTFMNGPMVRELKQHIDSPIQFTSKLRNIMAMY